MSRRVAAVVRVVADVGQRREVELAAASSSHAGFTPSRTYVGASVSIVAGTRADLVVAVADAHDAVVRDDADRRAVQLPALEQRAHVVLVLRLDDDEHALLRLAEHDLVRRHARLAARHLRHVDDRCPVPAFAAHSTARARQAGRAAGPAARRSSRACSSASSRHASISSFSRNGLPTCTAGRRSSDASSSCDAGERRAVDAVAAGVRADEHEQVAGAVGARLHAACRCGATPTHIAFTSGLP